MIHVSLGPSPTRLVAGFLDANESTAEASTEFVERAFWCRDRSFFYLGLAVDVIASNRSESAPVHLVAMVANCFPEFVPYRAEIETISTLPAGATAEALDLVARVVRATDFFGDRLCRPRDWSAERVADAGWNAFLIEEARLAAYKASK